MSLDSDFIEGLEFRLGPVQPTCPGNRQSSVIPQGPVSGHRPSVRGPRGVVEDTGGP